MLNEARDILGNMFLEDKLSRLREDFLERGREGHPPRPEDWAAGEQRIMEELQRRYYSRTARAMVKPDEKETISDDEDFAARTQTLGERLAFFTHRQLAAIPCHGDPEFSEG